ncbi:MAG: hypothetical protein HC893_06385 [Chloroflexaceae bacterium]|nr:hypothetical protein [Chloroflexaceae bacterium]
MHPDITEQERARRSELRGSWRETYNQETLLLDILYGSAYRAPNDRERRQEFFQGYGRDTDNETLARLYESCRRRLEVLKTVVAQRLHQPQQASKKHKRTTAKGELV